MSNADRRWALDMLKDVANDVANNYYDPTFHGIDWNARVEAARQGILSAPSTRMAISYIAAALDSLNDSHTYFLPPPPGEYFDFGMSYQIIGDDRCFITQVRKGSDAEAKGVKPGDELLTINGFLADRKDLSKMDFVLYTLRPQSSLHLLLQRPDGSSREVDVNAKVIPLRTGEFSRPFNREMDDYLRSVHLRSKEFGDQLMLLQLSSFRYVEDELDAAIYKARKRQALVLDLRGNSGGRQDLLQFLVGATFERRTKIADRVTRKGTLPLTADPRKNVYTGRLIVLVDSRSASAAELFARLVQIEKRGTVLGDRTAGSSMQAKHIFNPISYFGESITDADLIMTDGKSLEKIGVTPDEPILPSKMDLEQGYDPVLARAAELAGVKLTSEEAGKLFPYEWPTR